ncbi:hypothetical protein L611_000800001180 [Aminobacter sp. J15]|nr:hypothetical protein L611_000800001180 [Aminobacter sp. J15]
MEARREISVGEAVSVELIQTDRFRPIGIVVLQFLGEQSVGAIEQPPGPEFSFSGERVGRADRKRFVGDRAVEIGLGQNAGAGKQRDPELRFRVFRPEGKLAVGILQELPVLARDRHRRVDRT